MSNTASKTFILKRTDFSKTSTIGELTLDGEHVAYTLEDVVRGLQEKKIKDETAIPYGTYEVVYVMSPRLKKLTPRLLNVSGFDGILVHSGNESTDSSGCILLGTSKSKDWVSGSRDAIKAFEALLLPLLKLAKVYIKIIN